MAGAGTPPTTIFRNSRAWPLSMASRCRRIRRASRESNAGATCSSGCGRKHGRAIEAILDTRRQAAAELELLDTAETDLRAIAASAYRAGCDAQEMPPGAGAKRTDASGQLSAPSTGYQPQLGLPGGKFSLEMSPLSTIQAQGQNPSSSWCGSTRAWSGVRSRALHRAANCPPLSLALKVVLARHDAVPTLIFDELDQESVERNGCAGRECLGPGRRAPAGPRDHAPATDCRPRTRHLVVSKQARQGIATSDVEVHGEDRITELARMLGDADARIRQGDMLKRCLRVPST